MKKADYHIHPNILNKPEDADFFIEKAIALGFEEICFTDHMPFSVTGHEHDRIPEGRIGDYCETVRKKAAKYKEKISIKTGIEIDYYPACIGEIESVLSQGSFDYIIGSSHLNIKGFNIPLEKTTRTEFSALVLKNYISAINSGLFHTISHLDIYRWCFSAFPIVNDGFTYKVHLSLFDEIFNLLAKTGVNLEINAAPMYKKFDNLGAYPENEILTLCKDYPINYIYGSDAHFPEHLGYGYEEFIKMARDYNFTLAL